MTSRVQSFPPLADARARVLILGSMPGVASLRAKQYYAHPHNAFWRIMGGILGFEPAAPYRSRVAALRAARIAVWDVLRCCQRRGSLDSRIERESIEVNDFAAFLTKHRRVHRVLFNGTMAESSFRRLVAPTLALDGIEFVRLPSTSPANASWPIERKLRAWREALAAAAPIPAAAPRR